MAELWELGRTALVKPWVDLWPKDDDGRPLPSAQLARPIRHGQGVARALGHAFDKHSEAKAKKLGAAPLHLPELPERMTFIGEGAWELFTAARTSLGKPTKAHAERREKWKRG
jgi:hypothetical protein